jgi:hypothetical protein
MKNKAKYIILTTSFVLFGFFLLFIYCGNKNNSQSAGGVVDNKALHNNGISIHEGQDAELKEEISTSSIKLVFVGDIMLGRYVDKRIKSYDLKLGNNNAPFIDNKLRDIIGNADIAVGNLESPLTNTEPHDNLGIEFNADAKYTSRLYSVGFDILEFYRQNSEGSGYLRLNFETKKPYIEKIVDLCKEHNLKLAVSDAHLKTYGEMGCCCGVPEDWNYFKGQLTEAIVNAKKCGGCFSWDDLGSDLRYYEDIKYEKSLLNKISMKHLAEYKDHSVADFLQEKWANPTDPNSPSGYTDKNIIPVKLNENENIVYKIKDTKK